MTVVRSRFSTENMAGAQAFETWRSRGWPGFAAAFEVSGDPYSFRSEQTIFYSGRAALFSVDIVGQGYERTPERVKRDGRDHVLIQFTLRGGIVSGDVGRGNFFAGPGALAFCDFGRPSIHRSTDTRAITLLMEREIMREARLNDADLHGRVFDQRATGLLSDFMHALHKRFDEGPAISDERFDDALPKVLAACLRRDKDAQVEMKDTLAPLAIDRARRFIDATLTRPDIGVSDVVSAMFVSRATAYRLFEPFGGLARFRMERRLEAAARDVLERPEDLSLGDIADRYGFSDHAHFTRAFRERYGFPPSALRV